MRIRGRCWTACRGGAGRRPDDLAARVGAGQPSGMTLRIAVGGFLHESHSFAPRPTGWADFLNPGGFPPLVHGPALLTTLRGNANAIGGALAVADEAGAE